jgi:hypothetical protein
MRAGGKIKDETEARCADEAASESDSVGEFRCYSENLAVNSPSLDQPLSEFRG